MRKRILCATLCSLLSCISGFAGEGYDGLPFVRLGQDPVRTATGGAGHAYTGSMAYSSWGNAAAIPFSKDKMAFAIGLNSWQPASEANTRYISTGGAMNVKGNAGFALGITYGQCAPYDNIDESGKVSGSFTPGEMMINAGAGWRFVQNLSAGANIHYVSSTIAKDRTLSTISTDIFLLGQVKDFTFAAGVSALDFGGTLNAKLPTSASFGVAWNKTSGKHEVNILLDADYYFSGEMSVSAGAAYTFNSLVSARAGYHAGGIIPAHISAGIGLQFKKISINAAYLLGTSSDEFGCPMKNTFIAGLGIAL